VRRAAFLDRDGVLNRLRLENGVLRPPANAEGLELLPHVPEALALLADRGLLLVVVTNQPGVARGTLVRDDLDAIHARLRSLLPLHDVFACDHDDGGGCACRKPLPGLLLQAAALHAIDLPRSFMIGDRWKDVAAGRAAGCTTFLLPQPHSERTRCPPDHEAPDLLAAAREIVTLL